MILDLGPIIDEEAVPVTLTRKTGGAYNADGEWAGEATASSTVLAAVQPATGRKLLDLPEGERQTAEFFLWTREELVSDDIVIYSGRTFRIVHLWPRPDGGFTRAAIGLLRGD